MANRWTSAFTETNCSFPYFVVAGLTTDNIISDELAISDVKMMLHRHLIAQGFDAVVFYDPVHMLHFYDAKTSFIVRHTFVPTPQQLQSALARRDAPEGQPAPAQRPVFASRRRPDQQPAQENRSWGPVWEMNMGHSTVTWSYGRLYDLLSNTRFRCAVVFPDCMALQLESDPTIVQARHKALAAPQSNRAANRNIIIFMTESDPHNSINDVLMPRAQAGDLANFFSSYIVPKLVNDDMQNFLRIPPPNAAEIRNMLNMLRLTYGLQVDMGSLSGIAQHLATYCNKKWVSMASLFNLIRKWQNDHESACFGMNEASRITGSSVYKTVWQRLDEMVGLTDVKNHFRRLQSMSNIDSGDDAESPGRLWLNRFVSSMRGHGLNLAMLGNPGTGKSTLANLVGELYQELGLLPTASVTPVSATELTNAEALHERVRLSIGGVLLIDEAYALMNRIAGQDIIDALVADMGAYAGQFAVVLCGYPEQTLRLLEANDGLRRRIPAQNTLMMPDYTWQELKSIFFHIAAQDPSLDVSALQTKETSQVLDNIFRGWHGDAGPGWGNAGEVENLLNAVKTRCAERMSTTLRSAEEQADRRLHVTLQDLPENMQDWASSSEENLQTAYQELDNLTGMKNVKRVIFEVARTIQLSNGTIREPGFYVFHGPPGTGKSMMAEKVGKLFQMLGVIKRRTPYIITARKLLEPPESTRPGEFATPQSNRLQEALTLSENGILFIDEAHQLADTDEGRGLLRELVPLMETSEFRRKHCIILAGYTTEMENLFAIDSGLSSRFPLKNRIKFKNYSASELTTILRGMAEKDGETLQEAFLHRTEVALSKYLAVPRPNFGNARFMRNEYLVSAKEKRNVRILREQLGITSDNVVLSSEQLQQLTPAMLHTLTAADIPERPSDFAALAGPVDAPIEEPLTPARMVEQLYGKEEIQSFVRQITGAFTDNARYTGGINYTISGPLGCGKETVVRAIANTLAELELTESNEARFLSKGDLEAGFVGQTAGKTRRAVTDAQGGTVVLVNPSALLTHNANDNSFGPEALTEFFNCISVFGGNTSFVLVDSETGMENFFKACPAYRSTFDRHFVLDDLNVDSMQRIFRQQSADYIFDDDIAPLMDDFIANWTADRGGLGSNFLAWANGDEIDKLLHTLKDQWEIRKGEQRRNAQMRYCPVITREMFPLKLHKYLKASREERQAVLKSMDREIGLTRVKAAIRAIEIKMRRTSPERVMPGHYCFIGNPGVGKTRMAQKLGNVLQATNVLKQGLVITRTAREMMEQVADFDKIIRMARENVLFIDEAHQLADTVQGTAVIKKLLTVLEDTAVMKNTCIVLAGYPREMRHLFAVDAGLHSRFDTEDSIILFEDYTVDELVALLHLFARNASTDDHIGSDRSFALSDERNAAYVAEARRGLEYVVARRNPNYGNARYVRNLMRDTLTHQMMRLDALHADGLPITDEEWAVLLPEDLPEKYRSPDREQEQSSNRCVPAHKLSATPASPIVVENLSSSVAGIKQSIFLLQLLDQNRNPAGFGTGFAITEDGYLLTCGHVVKDAAFVRARLYYPGMIGGERWFEDCEILHPIREDVDMAIVKINGATGFVPLPLRAPDAPLDTTEPIIICGYPFGDQLQSGDDPRFEPSIFYGSISSIQGKGTDAEKVFIGCEAKQGNSGSPVISRMDGRVIGILRGSETKQASGGKLVEEINYFGPIRLAWERFVANLR